MGKSFHLSEAQFAHLQRLREGGGAEQRAGSGGGWEKESGEEAAFQEDGAHWGGAGGSLEEELGDPGLWTDLGKLPLPPSSGAATRGPARSQAPGLQSQALMSFRCYQLGATSGRLSEDQGSQPARPQIRGGSRGTHSPARGAPHPSGEKQAVELPLPPSEAIVLGHHSEHGRKV